MLASELVGRGLTREEAAGWLGVSRAAASNYHDDDAPGEDRFREDPRMERTVERIATGIATDSVDGSEALGELLEPVREFEDRGPICEAHEAAMPSLRGPGRDLCVWGFDRDLATERSVIANVRKASRLLADTPTIVPLVPDVWTNVGMALPEATDELDVAAVPGRIHAMCGRVNGPRTPRSAPPSTSPERSRRPRRPTPRCGGRLTSTPTRTS